MGGVPGQRGRALPQGLDGRRRCAVTASGSPRRWCATARPVSSAPPTWDEALDLVAERLRALRSRVTGRTRWRSSAAVGSPTRRPTSSASSPGSRWAPARSTTTAGAACRRRPPPANQALGIDRGLPFPLADLEETDVLVLVGSNLAETMPPAARHLDRLRERGGRVVVIDPRRTPTAERADLFLQPVPGTDLPLALGRPAPARRRRRRRRGVRRRADHRLRRGPPRGGRVVARAGRAGQRRPGLRAARARRPARRGRAGDGPDRPRGRAARPGDRHRARRGSTWRSRSACAAAPYAGYGCLTGQGNGQGGREHGQKADQLPGYRMIDDPAARAHVAPCGASSPTRCPGRGARRTSSSTRSAPTAVPRALLVFGSNIVVSAPNATHIDRPARLPGPAGRGRPGDVGDRGDGRRRAPRDPVGRGDGHHDQPRGPGDPAPAGRRRRRTASASTSRSSPGSPSGSARPVPFATRPRGGLRRAARASAGGKADYGGITYDRIRAEHGVFWPCPDPDAPRHAAAVRRPLRPPRRPGPVHRRRAPRPRRADRRGVPGPPHHRPGARAVPVRRPDPAGARPARHRPLRRAAPDARRPDRRPRRRARSWSRTRRGELKAPARVVTTIRPDTVFVPFHWVGANRLTNDALDPSSRMPEFKVCAAAVRA